MWFKNIKKTDGVIIVEKLIHALVNDGLGRGIHRGEFEWLTPGSGFPFRAIGEMSGLTNAGKYGNPLKECETCGIKGKMEGRITGQIVEGELKECEISGSYWI